MEDLESIKCTVCSGLAQYAVLTPCCSTLACRVCAITNIIKTKTTGECGVCHSSPVLLSSLVPQQQVRARVEEIEVRKQVEETKLTSNNNCQNSLKRALNDTNETNMIEPKRMKLNKSDHSAEIVNEIEAVETETETITSEITERINCGVAESIGSEVTNNSCSEVAKTTGLETEKNEPKSVKHRQESIEVKQDVAQNESRQGISSIEKELIDAKECLTIKEQELGQLKIFIEHKNEELNKVKLTLAEEKIKKIIEEKASLFESLTNERQNAITIKEELATKEEKLEQLEKDLKGNNEKLKKIKGNVKKIKGNAVALQKIGRNFSEKLALSEEERKRILEETKILNATLKSVKQENEKLKEKKS